VDVLEISPTFATGMKKVVVIGDVFSRFMMAIAVPAETAAAIAEVLFERWIAVFGLPVRLLSDRGKVFVSEVMQNLCARVRTKKAIRSCAAAQVQYDKAVKMCSHVIGDRVLIYHTPGETKSGQKLRVPWIEPYRITERHWLLCILR
jgi:hypothetical protein